MLTGTPSGVPSEGSEMFRMTVITRHEVYRKGLDMVENTGISDVLF